MSKEQGEMHGLLNIIENKYRLTMVTSKRARQINNGSPILIHDKAHKPTTMALEEVLFNKLKIDFDEKETRVGKNL